MQFTPAIVSALIGACAMHSEALNSERIAERFGSYGIEVLQYDDGLRRSSLFSLDGETRVCRTYAVVRFADEFPADVAIQHAAVLSGNSIGETFKNSGWQVQKATLYVGGLTLPDTQHPIAQLMRLHETAELAMHVYLLRLQRGRQQVDYATIIEIHHPEYLTQAELAKLYAVDARTAFTAAELQAVKALLLDTG